MMKIKANRTTTKESKSAKRIGKSIISDNGLTIPDITGLLLVKVDIIAKMCSLV